MGDVVSQGLLESEGRVEDCFAVRQPRMLMVYVRREEVCLRESQVRRQEGRR